MVVAFLQIRTLSKLAVMNTRDKFYLHSKIIMRHSLNRQINNTKTVGLKLSTGFGHSEVNFNDKNMKNIIYTKKYDTSTADETDVLALRYICNRCY